MGKYWQKCQIQRKIAFKNVFVIYHQGKKVHAAFFTMGTLEKGLLCLTLLTWLEVISVVNKHDSAADSQFFTVPYIRAICPC